jgi:hypothetical protein
MITSRGGAPSPRPAGGASRGRVGRSSWRHVLPLFAIYLLVLGMTAPQPAWSSAAGEGGQRSPKIFIYDLPENMTSKCWNTQSK